MVLFYVSLSGILLNHPELIGDIDTPIWLLPQHMRLRNWSRGSVSTGVRMADGQYVLGGKLGILRVDRHGSGVVEDNRGLPVSLYNRKINALYYHNAGNILYAGSVSGLYYKRPNDPVWRKEASVDEEVKSILMTDQGLCAIGVSHAFRLAEGAFERIDFRRSTLQPHAVQLVSYFFDLHAGRVLGVPGRLLMDAGGIVLIILACSGFYMWIVPRKLKSLLGKKFNKVLHRYHFLHYRKLGAILLLAVLLITLTGLFMQPPFLIVLAGRKIDGRLHIDPPEPDGWNGSIDRAVADPSRGIVYVASGLRLYEGEWDFSEPFKQVKNVVPAHPMGVTHLGRGQDGSYLIGSFSGLLKWNPEKQEYSDYFSGERITRPRVRIPKNGYQVNGLLNLGDRTAIIDYHRGVFDLASGKPFFEMPDRYKRRSVFSLWHFLFEVHNGRIWRGVLGGFYIFHTMVVSLAALAIVCTGLQIIISRRRKSAVRRRTKPAGVTSKK